MAGPLTGTRIVEFEGIGPAPYAGMLLADMGADVVKIARPAVARGPLIADTGAAVMDRGKRVVALDLKAAAGREAALALAARADGLIEGLRPGVMERLGFGPAETQALNPRLAYVRVTGWGQAGPLAQTAGHDINYIALTGALHAMGEPARPPVPPLNLVGDFGGGGMLAALGMLGALIEAGRTGRGPVVDSAMIDGAASQMAFIYAWAASGVWRNRRGDNLLDGAAPFYRCYTCAGGGFVAVGAIEPQFFRAMMQGVGLDPADWDQSDRAAWPRLAEALAARFATRSRDAWAELFAGTDACVTPVLSLGEASRHPHVAARATIAGSPPIPAPAPRFPGTEAPRARREASLAEVLEGWA
ncbi:CoA transferase [Limibaculum sp. FT325]|uniref:CaiB/BaiF CoA transferase family protein n=1 Tax=Thermohalobaculum sediminis TaxID=2939436 RepID=UPI0020BE0CB8|nr:CaiB/BaiF CoA-transferase family protein [Limibaculum sediminis]MCL5778785.1 CoA transferase [Limibaculum sediminis]